MYLVTTCGRDEHRRKQPWQKDTQQKFVKQVMPINVELQLEQTYDNYIDFNLFLTTYF